MEYTHKKQIQVQVIEEPATEKQIRFLETIARNVGLRINTNNITKEKARRVIDQLKLLDRRHEWWFNHQRNGAEEKGA